MSKEKNFETRVQYVKHMVIKAVAEAAWSGNLAERVLDIPQKIIPGNKPTMRCCVYKERAILAERVKVAMGLCSPDIIQVISIACDECAKGGYQVSDNCRGCLAHRCEAVCPRGAISFNEKQRAHIDVEKCVQCGKCSQVCPYSAIVNYRRPCENACKTGAIGMDEDGAATVRQEDCTVCGACVNQCPFGAIVEKSFILETVELLKEVREDPAKKLVAVVAPSIAVQYKNVSVDQVVAGLLKLGFTHVTEAALGADMTAAREARELADKGTLMSSCCPAFVSLVRKKFPELAAQISETPSPMVMVAMHIKERLPGAKVVFIGPCTAKKAEAELSSVKPFIDNVITFEEMDALFDARNIDLSEMQPAALADASRYGRNFARSGGVATAVTKAMREESEGLEDSFEIKTCIAAGTDECIKILRKAVYGRADGNFIEGMACVGGCINGPVSLRHLGGDIIPMLEEHAEEVKGRKILETVAKGAALSE